MFYPLKFIPICKNYIWGSESWDIASESIVGNGCYDGMSLEELTNKYPLDIVGSKANRIFPLMVKIIDAKDKLSVQVHPDDEYAFKHENGALGKTEVWHVLNAKPGAKLINGLKSGVDKETLAKAIENNSVGECLNDILVSEGDFFSIPAGTVHGIGGGIQIAEIQQNSNLTYRLYDYGRVDQQGNSRELHIEKAFDVIDFSGSKKENKHFSIENIDIENVYAHDTKGEKFYIYTFVSGEGTISCENGNATAQTSESVLVPAGVGKYVVKGSAKVLRSHAKD